MKKINKKTLVLTSIVTLIPLIVGALIWQKLPDTIPTHFGMDAMVLVPTGYSFLYYKKNK